MKNNGIQEKLIALCNRIEIPEVLINHIIELSSDFCMPLRNLYKHFETYASVMEFKAELVNDIYNFKILTCMLMLTLYVEKEYYKVGISEEVYLDTFKCFSRYLKESLDSYGLYKFDREWWVHRQLNMKIFRLGELEYEMTTFSNQNIVSIHIPSDANLDNSKCHYSYNLAKCFFEEYFPNYKYEFFVCDSWLLSPVLDKLLSQDSNILKFKNDFHIKSYDENNSSFMKWIYKKENLEYKDLSEETTLQRNVRRHLMNGGKIGRAIGYLKI